MDWPNLKEILREYKATGGNEDVYKDALVEIQELVDQEGPNEEWKETKWDERKETVSAVLDTYKGFVRVNILDILDKLDDEAKEMIVADGGWWNFISKEIVKQIIHGLSTKNFNSKYYEMRQALLTSNNMPKILAEFLYGLTQDYLDALREAKRYDQAYWSIYHTLRKYCDARNIDDEGLLNVCNLALKEAPNERTNPNSKAIEGWVNHFYEQTGMLAEVETLRLSEQHEAEMRSRNELSTSE